ncbi:DUF1489 family protein [Sagittula sp. SSi028]|uniref:DUF1489 family protein n=1 Tax=Sagittula sp. SSi028 TaxID=3400636 RepID=UPI003AF9F1D3
MADLTHLVKLSAGTESVESLMAWQSGFAKRFADGRPRHRTRMWPKKEPQIVGGGSIYWVIKGLIQCRQRVLAMEEMIADDGIRHCLLVLDPQIVRTTTAPKRAFQGWRYLSPDDAPKDLPKGRAAEEPLPPELAGMLAEIGVI